MEFLLEGIFFPFFRDYYVVQIVKEILLFNYL